jgi:hypothetical protein
MSAQLHGSIRIMEEARAICEADGHDFVPRHVQKWPGTAEYILTIEAPVGDMSDPNWSRAVKDLCNKLHSIEGVRHVGQLADEKLGNEHRCALFPPPGDRREAKRILNEAQQICLDHGHGTAINVVVPDKDGYLVDINFWPLEAKAIIDQRIIIKGIERRIQAIAGVISLSYAAPCELE